MNLSCDQFRRRTRKWSENAIPLTAERYPLSKRASEMSTVENSLSTTEYPLLVQREEGLLQLLAGLQSSPLDKTLQERCLCVQLYVKVMLRRLFDYQLLQSKFTLHLIQYFDRELASNYVFAAVAKNSQPLIDQQHLLPVYPPQNSVETVQCHSLIGVNVQSTSAQPSLNIIPPRLVEASPLSPDSNIVSSSCDHNGGILSSKGGDLKLTIPEGAIKDGDLVILSLASGLYRPFVLPSKCQADMASPYYWIGVSGSYQFHKQVQVEFEHFAVVTACDPSHYQLLCCEDDDESYTMRPVDYELSFTVRDEISLCTFETNHFCYYCLYHCCKDPKINRIGAFYLKPSDIRENQFSVEIWFSLCISHCLNRNRELYEKDGMTLERSYLFEAPSNKTSKGYFTLNYHREIDGWNIIHSRSTTIKTKEVNFYNYYRKPEELRASEEASLFPPRFIINVRKKIECTTNLKTGIDVTLCDDNEVKASVMFILFHTVTSGITV